MKRNKYVIVIALILIAGVLFFGRGVNSPISPVHDYTLFVYEGTDGAYALVESAMENQNKDLTVKVKKLPSDNPDDYLLAYTNVALKVNTDRKVIISAAVTSESSSLDETDIVIYTGDLSKKELTELKEDIGVKLTYKVGAYKEKEMFLSPKEYGYKDE